VESEEDPNAKIQAYCSAQGLPLPEGEGLEPAIAAMEAAKEFLDESTLAMQEARMATLRPGIADTYTDTPAEGPSCLQARFESDKAVVLLSTPSFDGDPELALWTVAYAGAPQDAPARPKVAGFGELNVQAFWDKLQAPDPFEAHQFLCWMRGVEPAALEQDTRADMHQDFLFCLLMFMAEQKLSPEQGQHVVALADSLYQSSVTEGSEATKRGTFTPERSFAMLKAGLLALASPGETRDPLLKEGQVSALAHYFARTFFAHYELYVYAHINPQAELKIVLQKPVETSMPPLKMSVGMSQEDYDEKLRLEAEAKKHAEDSAQRDKEAAELTKMLENMDPETEAVVAAVVRRQERALRRQYEEYYENMDKKMTEMEAQ